MFPVVIIIIIMIINIIMFPNNNDNNNNDNNNIKGCATSARSRSHCYYGYYYIVAIFYPFGQFCEIDISLPSLQTQPNTAPNLFQRG